MQSHIRYLQEILSHPRNQRQRLSALLRYVGWNLGRRLIPDCLYGIELLPGYRLLVSNRENYSTLVYTCGLYDFSDMLFVLHSLRPGDGFADVGANVGSYSVLAGSTGARVLSVEPVPSTFQRLTENRRLNRVEGVAVNSGVGESRGEIAFTTDRGGLNRVATRFDEAKPRTTVPITTLDQLVSGHELHPYLLKLDVEGYELPVLRGAASTLEEDVNAVIVELNGSGRVYGFTDEAVHQQLSSTGFAPFSYDPSSRELAALSGPNRAGLNTIYVKRKGLETVRRRVREASPVETVFGTF